MHLAQLFKQARIGLLESPLVGIGRVSLEIVDPDKDDNHLGVERTEIVTQRSIGDTIRDITRGIARNGIFVEARHRPFGHDVVVVAHKSAAAKGIHLEVRLEAVGNQEGVTLGGIRLLEHERFILSILALVPEADRKRVADKFDAAVTLLGRSGKLARLVGRDLVEAHATGIALADLDQAVTMRGAVTRSLYFIHRT